MVIIIGAGPIGIACGIELKKHNIPVLLIDKGCLVNSIFLYPTNMTFFSTSERLEIGDIPFISHNVKPTRKEALEYYRRVAFHYELPLHLYEGVQSIKKETKHFVVQTDKDSYEAEKVIVSTGFYSAPELMGIPGEDLPKVRHYYNEPHPYSGQRVLIIGGGNSAVDAALETYRCDAEVTMIIRGNSLKEGVKYWVRPDIENRIKEGGISALFETEVKEIKADSVLVENANGSFEIENDFVLAMTGYRPDFQLLESAGIALRSDTARTPVYSDITHETNIKGLYLAGVICGGLNTSKWFIENSREHAGVIAKHIADKI